MTVCAGTSEDAALQLAYEIGTKIGKILKLGASGFQVDESAIPECKTADKVPVPTESVESSTVSSSQAVAPLEENIEIRKDKE